METYLISNIMNKTRRLRIGIISNPPLIKTGLARNTGAYLPLLFKSNKYEIFMLCQGMHDNSPEFQKLPFKCFGVFRNFDQNRFNQDDSYRRFVSYGNAAVEEFVIGNKLDIVIHSDDIWSSNFQNYCQSDWYKHIKQNFIQHTTCDSLPILPDFKDWAQNCPNMWFWTGFAEKTLKEENYELYKHCKTLHGAIKSEDFFPINKQERLQLRHKFNIKDDEKVLIYLGRNQTRKVGFWANIEALAKFKKYHPNKKIKLLYHCHFSEPGGWPIDRLRDENGLAKEDILCTYFCQKCNEWNIQQFEGEGLDCPCCKTQKSRITAGISSTINEKDLNRIYNIADASVSYSNSAGLEYTNVESLLAGLPLSTVPYSGTSEFTNEEFVHSVNGTFTREAGTSFKKFVPDINSIVKFFEYICDLPENKRKDITERGRKWAIEQFDAKNVVKKYEEFFDSCQPINWDEYHKKRSEIKNINATIEHKDNNDDFIVECYSKILGMTPDKQDDGRKYWNQFLSQPGDQNQLRNSMVQSMRGAGQEHNNKIAPKLSLEDLLDNSGRKRIGVVIPESIGDVFLSSAILDSIRNRYPKEQWALHFITKPENFDILDCNPNIDKLIPYSQEFDNLLLMEGAGNNKGFFDILYPLHFGTQRILDWTHNSMDKHDLNLVK